MLFGFWLSSHNGYENVLNQCRVQIDLSQDGSAPASCDANNIVVGSEAHAKVVLLAIQNADREDGKTNGEIEEQSHSTRRSIMIFLNSAHNAKRFALSLRTLGQSCAEYHKLISSQEKENNLLSFESGVIRVLVCTDSAARGLDFPNVRHVIQAEFALNVVQHQHRVGRASRAGRAGRSTNFYGASAQALVDSIVGSTPKRQLPDNFPEPILKDNINNSITNIDGIGEGHRVSGCASIEQSFSRRRGFRRNLKRAEERRKEG